MKKVFDIFTLEHIDGNYYSICNRLFVDIGDITAINSIMCKEITYPDHNLYNLSSSFLMKSGASLSLDFGLRLKFDKKYDVFDCSENSFERTTFVSDEFKRFAMEILRISAKLDLP